ncbi:helix-turn-helix domain-containing protein [Fructobacillus tropaeoli]|uniref:helix-turn-helix domain-containing protein n=1 Tax=Fructobacillus tropaeoli TaxID=709323 RepID=UPI001455DE66|nr:helix-turn-helix transcriptional regulator [Fructobacillus tropaeoli]NLS38657.1 helix-turn-helix domain-containing protein [Fructobacillus tropaeoli]
MTIFDNIKLIAKKRGMNLKTVAQKSGLGENSIYRWKNETPRIDSLNKVAKTLNVRVSEITGEDDVDNHPSRVDILDDEVILAFDGMEIPEEDREKLKEYARFVMDQRKQGKRGRLHL